MKKIKKTVVVMLVLAILTVQTCFAGVLCSDKSITLSYELGKDGVDKLLSVSVFAPNKSVEDLESISEPFKDTIIFSKQVKADKDGKYEETFKFNYNNAASGMYTAVISGKDVFKTERFLYTNKLKTTAAIGQINQNTADAGAITDILKVSSYDLGVDDKYFAADIADEAATLIVEYLEDNAITEENAESIVNKAVAVAALNAGKIDNLIDEAKIFDLDNSSIKAFYKEDYVIDSVGADMTDRISGKNIQSFEAFDEALTEGFVLAVVKNPNGSDNTKSVMQAFAGKIGISQSGTTAQYEYVSNKNYETYEALKGDFENAPSGDGGGSSSGGGGSSSGGGGSSSGGGGSSSGGGGSSSGGGGSLAGSSNKTQSITYNDDSEKEEHTPYPITIFNDLDSVSWAEDAIIYLAENQIINGKEKYKFAPNDEITREEFLKIVLSAFNLADEDVTANTFKDVKSGSWYEEYVNTAYALGIITGHSDEIFGVGEKITRQDMAVIVDRAAKKAKIILAQASESAAFSDDVVISDYAKQSVYLLKNAGVINGMGDGSFAPAQHATRAQAALMIYNIISR